METYYKPEDLPKFEEIGKEATKLAKKFFEYYGEVFTEGELTEREKSLIALAVAHAIQCPYCIDAYSQACLEKASNLAEMTEALHVVTAIRGVHPLYTEYRCATSPKSFPWLTCSDLIDLKLCPDHEQCNH